MEIVFHKGVPWIYNNEAYPIVKYKLIQCKGIDTLEWESMDTLNDGIFVEVIQADDHFIFKTTDLGDHQLKIECKRIIKKEDEYDKSDLVDLIKEIQRQHDDESAYNKKQRNRIEILRHFLNKELDNNIRKIDQANWLAEDKKQFLLGQNGIIQKVLDHLI